MLRYIAVYTQNTSKGLTRGLDLGIEIETWSRSDHKFQFFRLKNKEPLIKSHSLEEMKGKWACIPLNGDVFDVFDSFLRLRPLFVLFGRRLGSAAMFGFE